MHEHLESELTFSFEAVARGGASTLAWLRALRRYGLTLLSGAAEHTGELRRLSEAVGVPLRRTNYGENSGETYTHALLCEIRKGAAALRARGRG
eukprot:483947-Prymnesium_polylepis.1